MFYLDEEQNENGFDVPDDDDERRFGTINRYGGSSSSNGSDELARRTYIGRDTDRFFGSFSDEDEDEESEENEQPAELVPLGMHGGRRKRGNSINGGAHRSTGFFDYYKLTEEHLGSGAYAKVQTCVSLATNKEYAVKIVDKKIESHSHSRLMREVKTFNLCKGHPNIVQLIEWFESDDHFYMVFEKMRGGPLLQHILIKGSFTEEEARLVTKDITSALKFLHDHGIAHRDVKPENVLCTEPNHLSTVKLCDLDLASRPVKTHTPPLLEVASEPHLLTSPVGSAEFMAPEVVDTFVGEALKYDKRCDMWSLGIIVYVMLCGYTPFQGQCDDEECGWMDGQSCDACQESLFQRIQQGIYDFPDEDWADISEEAKDLVRHLLVKNVRERYNADEVLKHPWLKKPARKVSLLTANNLMRKDSARDMQQMTENFNVMQRMVSTRLSQHLGGGDLFDFPAEPEAGGDKKMSMSNLFGRAISEETSAETPPTSIPLFMIPPAPFFDEFSNEMIYPPSSLVEAPIIGSAITKSFQDRISQEPAGTGNDDSH